MSTRPPPHGGAPALRLSARVLRYAWAAPATLVGAGCALVAMAGGARPRVVRGCVEVTGGRLRRMIGLLPRVLRFDAITLGHVVLCVDCATAELVRAHEHVHIRQYERWGVLFFPLYVGSSALQFIAGRDPYRDNRFEREAFAHAGD